MTPAPSGGYRPYCALSLTRTALLPHRPPCTPIYAPFLQPHRDVSVFIGFLCPVFHRLELENSSALLVGGHLPTAVCGNAAFSDLTCNIDGDCPVPRKRARVEGVAGAGFIGMQGHGAVLPPLPAFQPAGDAQQQQQSCKALCSAAASTSGRAAGTAAPSASHGLLSLLYRHTVEVDALVRVEVRHVSIHVAVGFCRDRRV